MISKPIFVASAARTPIGAYLGALAELSAVQLGRTAIQSALERAHIQADAVDEVLFGNVMTAGLGQAPARQAAIAAGIPHRVPATTVGKVCGSGLQAVILGAKTLLCGDAEIVVAGGMESMSNVPYYLTRARTGYRMGHGELIDGMILDGLWDPYNNFHMAAAGELCAREFRLDREAQDRFAAESYRRAIEATEKGYFADEMVAVEVPRRKGPPQIVDRDEEPARADVGRFASLKPAFDPEGTITAANASSINDGAAAIVLATEAAVERHGLEPLARLVGYGGAAQAPEWFTTAPAAAIEATLRRTQLKAEDIDLWEVNEAFSCVPLACSRIANIPGERLNVHGGAVALGHPIGASGARIATTLLHAMRRRKAKRGLATLCIGGGEAVAVVFERV